VLGVIAALAVAHQDAEWWPLVGPALGVVLWAVLIAGRRRSTVAEALAVGAFAGGALLFGILADSLAASVLGVAVAIPLAAGFPWLHERARHLLEQPARVGLESYVGRAAEVVRWEGASGTVRLDGSLWNATSTHPLSAGDPVSVVAHSGMTLTVAPRVAHPA
jgi:membrane protein implicated in regulation of membrane protease activity